MEEKPLIFLRKFLDSVATSGNDSACKFETTFICSLSFIQEQDANLDSVFIMLCQKFFAWSLVNLPQGKNLDFSIHFAGKQPFVLVKTPQMPPIAEQLSVFMIMSVTICRTIPNGLDGLIRNGCDCSGEEVLGSKDLTVDDCWWHHLC